MCSLNGADYDASQSGTNVLNLGGSVIENGTIFGTVTYRATMTANTLVGNTITGGNVTSGADPGHTHTGASLGSIDISDDTNLTASTNITLTDDDLAVDDAFIVNDAADTMLGDLTINAADPALILDGSTASDTDFWIGLTADEVGDDNDDLQFGKGTSKGTTPFFTFDENGGFLSQNLSDAVTGIQILDSDGGIPILNIDTDNERVGIGIAAPLESLHLNGSAIKSWWQDTGNGAAALTRTMAGLQLSSLGMSASAKYTPAIKFMSTDAQFTTENPKLLALIVGRATETYNTDLKSGMAIDFATTANSQGATVVPTVNMTLDEDGNLDIPNGNLTLSGEITSLDEDFIPVATLYPQGDGSNNAVTCTGMADGTNRRLFNRTDGISDTQDMDWYGERDVNQTPTSLTLWTRASDFANCAMTIQVWDQGGNADATGAVTITPTGDDTWEEFTYTFTSAYTNDEELWIKIAITSLDTSDTIDFGRIKVNY
jgi:hypothetical protein